MYQLKQKTGPELALLQRDRLNIGRDSVNDIVLDDDRISGFHAAIIREGEAFELVDLGSTNGTRINGQSIQGRYRLRAWDVISFAGLEVEVIDTEGRRPTRLQAALTDKAIAARQQQGTNQKAPASPTPAANQPILKLRSNHAGLCPQQLPLQRPLTVGRGPDNDIQLQESTVSSHHARLVPKAQGWEVIDAESTNGTWVNGQQVHKQRLKHGDRVRFDLVEYEVILPTPAADASKTIVRPAINTAATQVNPALEPGAAATITTAAATNMASQDNELDESIAEIRRQIASRDSQPQPAVEIKAEDSRLTPDQAPTRMEIPAARPATAPTLTGPAYTPAPMAPQRPRPNPEARQTGTIPPEQYGLKWLLFSFRGRLSRLQHFLTLLAMQVGSTLFYLLLMLLGGGNAAVQYQSTGNLDNSMAVLALTGIASLVFTLLFCWASLAIAYKRNNDIGRPFTPIVNAMIISTVLGIAGSSTDNLAIIIGAGLVSLSAGLYLLLAPGTPASQPNPNGPVRDRVFR